MQKPFEYYFSARDSVVLTGPIRGSHIFYYVPFRHRMHSPALSLLCVALSTTDCHRISDNNGRAAVVNLPIHYNLVHGASSRCCEGNGGKQHERAHVGHCYPFGN